MIHDHRGKAVFPIVFCKKNRPISDTSDNTEKWTFGSSLIIIFVIKMTIQVIMTGATIGRAGSRTSGWFLTIKVGLIVLLYYNDNFEEGKKTCISSSFLFEQKWSQTGPAWKLSLTLSVITKNWMIWEINRAAGSSSYCGKMGILIHWEILEDKTRQSLHVFKPIFRPTAVLQKNPLLEKSQDKRWNRAENWVRFQTQGRQIVIVLGKSETQLIGFDRSVCTEP